MMLKTRFNSYIFVLMFVMTMMFYSNSGEALDETSSCKSDQELLLGTWKLIGTNNYESRIYQDVEREEKIIFQPNGEIEKYIDGDLWKKSQYNLNGASSPERTHLMFPHSLPVLIEQYGASRKMLCFYRFVNDNLLEVVEIGAY